MSSKSNSKALHIALWVAQGLLAAAFGMAGYLKLTAPMDQLLANGMTFVANYEPSSVRLIGVAELLAVLGLILPTALRKFTVATPMAALGLAVVMILAAHYHLTHNESAIANLVFLALTLFVAWGRFSKAPIPSK
jgi:hypothetical protein